MDKVAAAIAAMIMCVSATPVEEAPVTERYHSRTSFALPPARFTQDNAVFVIFATNVDQFCGKAPEGYTTLGCHRMVDGAPVLILPNPSRTLLTPDEYQRLVAHELAHRSGWPGDHPL